MFFCLKKIFFFFLFLLNVKSRTCKPCVTGVLRQLDGRFQEREKRDIERGFEVAAVVARRVLEGWFLRRSRHRPRAKFLGRGDTRRREYQRIRKRKHTTMVWSISSFSPLPLESKQSKVEVGKGSQSLFCLRNFRQFFSCGKRRGREVFWSGGKKKGE